MSALAATRLVAREAPAPSVSVAWALACAWPLAILTFSLPGRDGPASAESLDVIALAKLAARFGSLAVLGWAVVRLWNTPRMRAVMSTMLPLWLYAAWAFLSAGWSALPSITIGQAISLVVLLLLSAVTGATWRGEEDTRVVLGHLSLILLLFASALVAIDRVNHDLSGLNREDFNTEASSGLIHPTSAGATASLGLVLVVASRLLWGWSWPRYLLVPALLVHPVLLAVANSRMALVMAVVVLGLIVVWFTPVRAMAACVLLLSLAGMLYVTLDPQTAVVEWALKRTTSHVSRGESAESMSSLTGRTALWEAIWAECQRSPLVGHGYFVTSHNGQLDVWSGPANRSAHNFFLQVQVTTGLVGLVLFLWGYARVVAAVVRATFRQGKAAGALPAFLAVLGLWYLGWGQLCESFMGPIQTEAVVFYTALGLALGLASREVPS